MARDLDIRFDTADLMKKVGSLNDYGKIMSKAMSKVKTSMKKQVSDGVRELYRIGANEVKNATYIRYEAYPPEVVATIKSRRYTLARFVSGGFGKAVGRGTFKVKVKKDKAKEPTPRSHSSFFFKTNNGGNFLTAHRIGKGKKAIKVERTISVSQMAIDAQVSEKIYDNMLNNLNESINKQHAEFFKKQGK